MNNRVQWKKKRRARRRNEEKGEDEIKNVRKPIENY
jgi:hypothetical protein